jgi:signal recognition particle subunit SRP54
LRSESEYDSAVSGFDLRDFAANLRALQRLGSMKDLMRMVPGLGPHVDDLEFEDDLPKVLAIIDSMTPRERARPEILKASRRSRIARGSGTSRELVDDLLEQFFAMKKATDRSR